MSVAILACLLIGYIYEDKDSLIVYNDSLVICGSHHYNVKVDIAHKGKLKVRQWSITTDSTGWLNLDAPWISIQNSSSIDGSKTGYQGGLTNGHPQGYGPGGGGSGMSGGGGGAGYGGVGGIGGDVTPGDGGSTYGDDSDTLINIGSGGGAGRLTFVDGPGGNGGASVSLRAQNIIMDSSHIETDGQRGYDGALEAGGAGSGGGIIFWANSILIYNSVINANGGDGGDAEFGGGGGAGGGRIKIFPTSYLDTIGLVLSVQGGDAGYGFYGSPEPGIPGSVYIGPIPGVIEVTHAFSSKFVVKATIVRNIIEITIADPPIRLKIYDTAGRIVKTFWVRNNAESINLNDLHQGIYFIKSETDKKYLGKIILLK